MAQWRREAGRFVIDQSARASKRHQSNIPARVASPYAVRHFGAFASKLMLSCMVLALASLGLIGTGAWAAFNDNEVATTSVSTGRVSLALGSAGSAANRLTVNATGLVPGDTIQRAIDVTNDGTTDWLNLKLTTTATVSSLLDTDATNGLQMVIQACSVAWTESGSAPAYTYTCSGSTTTSVASRAIIGSNITVADAPLTASAVTHYRVTLTLPTSATTSMQDNTSTISYSFTSTQRNGTNK